MRRFFFQLLHNIVHFHQKISDKLLSSNFLRVGEMIDTIFGKLIQFLVFYI